MTETDVFERRLRAALVRHTDGAPTAFDALAFARTVAAREPRRHGLGAMLGWRWVAVPQVAWVVLLLAALLLAMVAGMLIAGSQPEPKLSAVMPSLDTSFACPPGAHPDTPGPKDQARPATVGAMAFDRRSGRMVVLSNGGAGIETWTFDACTNTWIQMHPAVEPATVGWQPLVYDVDADVAVLVASGKVWAYDLQADSWTEKKPTSADMAPWAYDPRTGLVVASDYDSGDLWSYDVVNDAWTPIHQVNRPGVTFAYASYDASIDRIVGYDQGYPSAAAWLFDIRTGTWSRSRAKAPAISAGYGMQAATLAYDEGARRTVVFGDRLGLFDAMADRWEGLDAAAIGRPAGGGSWPVFMVYDPVNLRLVGWPPDSEGSANVVALDLVTREWATLLGGR